LLLEGDTLTASASVLAPDGAVIEDADVRWSAYPVDIVSVSSRGLIRGLALGTGYVAAAAGNAADTASVEVRVRFEALSAGAAHTCGVTTAGSVYCWGWNREGRLGTGSLRPSAVPSRAATVATFAQVSAGWEITCGLSARGASCWGSNRSGQVGSGVKDDALYPVPVADDPSLVAIATHTTHSCGIAGRDAHAWCWGAGWTGQRGAGEAPGARLSPVAGDLRFRALDVGWLFSCGVTTDGTAYCWGTNDGGQLGRPDAPAMCGWPDGSSKPCATVPVPVASSLAFDTIAVGTSHACVLTTDGAASCWGRNDAGQVGDGSTVQASSPQPVRSAVTFRMVTAGDRHTCALDADGAAWCWGDNRFGALGNDDVRETCDGGPCAATPVPVNTVLRFRWLTASRGEGGAHTCGLATDGLAYCWGDNTRGQLGTGRLDSGGAAPQEVAGQRR